MGWLKKIEFRKPHWTEWARVVLTIAFGLILGLALGYASQH